MRILYSAFLTIFGFMLYARMGMHVADDGIVLAAAKRIFIDGEIPHRDFISLRPVGTFFYWIPSLLFPDNLVNTASRFFVMIQMTLISYSWMSLYERLYKETLSKLSWIVMITIVYLFCVSTFWLFPLYTTDGVFFASVGIALVFNRKKLWNYLGYILLGCACLAKQNFAAMIPAVLITTFDVKDLKKNIFPLGLAILAPASYLAWLHHNHALSDFQLQMKQYPLVKTFLTAGIYPYLKNKYFYMGVVLGLVSFVNDERKLKYLRPLALTFLSVHILQNLFLRGYLFRVPIFICGFSFSLFLSSLIQRKPKEETILVFLACGLGWTSSFSLVFQYPHAAGYLLLPIFHYFLKDNFIKVSWRRPLSISTAVVLVVAFTYNRYAYTFENSTAYYTPNTINDEYPGAKGMVVGDLMFDIFKRLKQTVQKYRHGDVQVSILPDFTNYWVTSKERNPLPVLWLVSTDIVGDELVDRIIKAINKMDKGDIFIVENYHGYSLQWKPKGKQVVSKPTDWDPIIQKVLSHIEDSSQLVESNEYFDVYRKN